MEAFSSYAAHMNNISKYFLEDTAKFFEYGSL
jgi:hypothetical protein